MSYFDSDTRKTILYADKHGGIRKVTSEMLERLGYRVIDCKSSSEAISFYYKFKDEIDLIFLDLVLPTMDSVHCIEELTSINND